METPTYERLTYFGKFLTIKTLESGEQEEVVPDENLQLDIGSYRVYNINTGLVDEELTNSYKKIEILFNRGEVVFESGCEPISIAGFFPVVMDWRTYPPVDLGIANIDAAQKIMNGWLLEMGKAEGSPYWKKLHHTCVPMLTAFFSPGVLLADQFTNTVLMFLFVILDDIFDNYKDFWSKGIPTLEMVQAVDAFCSICRGEGIDEDTIKNTNFPQFQIICRLFGEYRESLVPYGFDKCEQFINWTVDCLECNAWETLGWVVGGDDPRQQERFYYFRRESTYGWLPFHEWTAVCRNISVSDRIRRDPLFDLCRRRWVRASLTINDMFSVQKEIMNGEESNILLIRTKRMSATRSFQYVLDELRMYSEEMGILQRKLERKYRNSPLLSDLRVYLDLGRAIFDTNNQFTLLSERYGRKPFTAKLYV